MRREEGAPSIIMVVMMMMMAMIMMAHVYGTKTLIPGTKVANTGETHLSLITALGRRFYSFGVK